jgi:hypothetical protein
VGRSVTQNIHVSQCPTVRKWLVVVCVAGCSDREVRAPLQTSPLETAIARELTARAGAPATTRCVIGLGVAMCKASVDGVAVPVVVENHRGEWVWWIEGGIVPTAEITARVRDELADLGVAQTVDCGKAIARGARVVCSLSGGGKAFATIGKGGEVSLELALDPVVAGVRSEAPRDLTERSRSLDRSAVGEQEEDAVGSDTGSEGGRVPP